MKAHRTDVTKCPSCGYDIDAHSPMGKDTPEDAVPRPGDVTLCLRCLCYMEYGEGLSLRVLSPAEFQALPDETRADLIRIRVAGWQIDARGQIDATASRRARRSP